jgi:hypothetical protein
MKKTFKAAVLKSLDKNEVLPVETMTEADIQELPQAIQKYIRYTGCIGKEKVRNFRAEFKGGIRSQPSVTFMPFHSVQYNFLDEPTRLFYITAKKVGIRIRGIHIYAEKKARMLIKILGLFTVTDAKGAEMDQSETVTIFNDMCFMAPASLIDKRITWKEIDNKTVTASFKNGSIEISATLYFDENGGVANFISNNRYETTNGRTYSNYPWLTPVTEYRNINGYRLPSSAKLIYRYPEEDFCYGEFNLVNIEYNCRDYK